MDIWTPCSHGRQLVTWKLHWQKNDSMYISTINLIVVPLVRVGLVFMLPLHELEYFFFFSRKILWIKSSFTEGISAYGKKNGKSWLTTKGPPKILWPRWRVAVDLTYILSQYKSARPYANGVSLASSQQEISKKSHQNEIRYRFCRSLGRRLGCSSWWPQERPNPPLRKWQYWNWWIQLRVSSTCPGEAVIYHAIVDQS